jgi:hypothetical protein
MDDLMIYDFQTNEPWPGYDEMTAAEIVDVLSEASREVASRVREYEEANKDRVTIIRATHEEPEPKEAEPETDTFLDALTGTRVHTLKPPPLPKGKPPAGGRRLRYRLNPENRTVIQCKWNSEYQEWSDYVLCENVSEARSTLTILTGAEWRLKQVKSGRGPIET